MASAAPITDFVCVSQQRWEIASQDPDHLPWRFMRKPRVFLIEEPVARPNTTRPYLEVTPVREGSFTNVTVIRLVCPGPLARDLRYGDQTTQAAYNPLLRDFLEREGVVRPVLWLGTPLALKFGLAIDYSLLVYGWSIKPPSPSVQLA